jgi:hypothetical protein
VIGRKGILIRIPLRIVVRDSYHPFILPDVYQFCPSVIPDMYECLLLQPTGVKGTFRRLGYVNFADQSYLSETGRFEKHEWEVMQQEFVRKFQTSSIPPLMFHEVDNNMMFTITIV